MATNLSLEQVLIIADRENWPAEYRKRGGVFGVINSGSKAGAWSRCSGAMQREYLAHSDHRQLEGHTGAGRPGTA